MIASINQMYGGQYLFEIIPSILRNNKQEVNIKNVLGSYNAGPTAFRRGNYNLKKFPQVNDYINKIEDFYNKG